MECNISEDQLLSWIDRGSTALEAHLAICPECRRRAEEYRSVIGGLGSPAGADEHVALPERVGPYPITRLLGRGGMGVVYEAEQANPRRNVALKVMRGDAGGSSRDPHLARLFQRETRTLARLKHSGIAAIYDAGTTPEGCDFFTMELVEGEPLNRYVRGRSLPLRRRLGLFCRSTDAVHYAHQRGVIHRDLKPSNIVMDAEGNPKILDFGLSRLCEGDDSLATASRDAGHLRGTLPYMSPEQVRGGPVGIDVRTDVYSLGVILFELLTGEMPYRLSGVSLPEAARIICEQAPRRPSALSPALRGDLETIILKALQKEPDRRYASAAALADDVRRYLANQPVLAQPPSAAYLLRKFASRNKALVAVTSLALVALVLTSALAVLQAVKATRARDESESVVTFLDGMLASVNPLEAQGELYLKDVLDRAAPTIEQRFGDKPLIEARVRNTIGGAYLGLGDAESAARHLERAWALRRDGLGEDHPDTLTSLSDLALVRIDQGRYQEGEEYARQVMDQNTERLGPDSPVVFNTMNILGRALKAQGRFEDARRIYAQALAGFERSVGTRHLHALNTMNNLANVLMSLGAYDSAEEMARRALEGYREGFGNDSTHTINAMNTLAGVLWAADRLDEAEEVTREAWESMRRLLGDEHPQTWNLGINHAKVLAAGGRWEEAESILRDAVRRYREELGVEHPDTLAAMSSLSTILLNRHATDQAEVVLRESLPLHEQVLGPEHPKTLSQLNQFALLLSQQRKWDEAEPLFRELLQRQRTVLGPEHPTTLGTTMNLARMLRDSGRFEEAEVLYRELVDVRRRVLGDEHKDTLLAREHYAVLLEDLSRYAEAGEHFRVAYEARVRVNGESDVFTLLALRMLGENLVHQGRVEDAEALLAGGCAVAESSQDGTLARRQIWTSLRKHWGRSLLELGRYEQAERVLLEVRDAILALVGEDSEHYTASIEALVDLYDAWDKPDEADRYRALLPESDGAPAGAEQAAEAAS